MLRQKGWSLAERGYQIFLKTLMNFGLTLRPWVDQAKLTSWYEHFQRDYPETFRVGEAMETEEGQTRSKKPNLAEIRERQFV